MAIAIFAGATAAQFFLIRKQNKLLKESIAYTKQAFELLEDGHFIMETITEVIKPTPEQNALIAERVDIHKWEKSFSNLEFAQPQSR